MTVVHSVFRHYGCSFFSPHSVSSGYVQAQAHAPKICNIGEVGENAERCKLGWPQLFVLGLVVTRADHFPLGFNHKMQPLLFSS